MQYGGKVVINSAKKNAADGGWAPTTIVVVEFESVEQAYKRYNSPEYQAVIGQRLAATDSATAFINV